MKKIKITSLIFAFIIFVSFMSAVNISAEGTDQHRHVWITAEEESPIHDAEHGGHRQVRECAATVNGERCTETRVFYVRRPGCELCAAKDGDCSHNDIMCIGEQSAHPHYKVYECQECGYQFTNGTMANWHWNDYSTSSTHTSGLGHAITQKCSKCSATQIGGYDTDYPGCCQCGNHTFISGYTQYLYSSAHPHAEYYRCEVCDANVYTGGYYSGEYPGCSACHVHNYSYSSYYQTAHPHYKVNVCSCGAEQVTSVTSTNTSCCDCGYHSYSSYSYYQTAHPHYKVNVCSCGAEQVTSVTSTNTSCCQCSINNPHVFSSGACIYCGHEPIIANGVYKIKSVYNGLYVDVKDGGTSSGTDVQQWSGTSNDGNRNQLFKITYLGTYGNGNLEYYSIRPMVNSGLGLYSDYTTTDYVKANDMSLTDTFNISFYQCWAISKTGNFYRIKNGTDAYGSYLTTAADSNNGSLISTQSYVSSRSDWILEQYTGETIHGVTFSTFTDMLIPSETFAFSAVMYCSQTGVNGPVTYDVRNEDGTVTDKATINSSTGALTALQTGKIQVRATYTGAPSIWYRLVNIEKSLEGDYYIKNKSTKLLLTPNTSTSSSDLQQWDYNSIRKQGWVFVYDGEGYYKIVNKVNNKLITSPTNNISSEKITLETAISGSGSDRQLWRLIVLDDNTYQIKAKNRSSFVMTSDSASGSNGTTVSQNGADSGNVTVWYIAQYYAFITAGGSSNATFTLKCVGDLTINSTWLPLITEAAAYWNGSDTNVDVSVVTSGSAGYTIEVVYDDYEAFGWFTPSQNKIDINANLLPTSSEFRKSTIAHEVGHILWLNDNPPVEDPDFSIMHHSRDRYSIYEPQEYDRYNVFFWFYTN